jgi:hypothetical protein
MNGRNASFDVPVTSVSSRAKSGIRTEIPANDSEKAMPTAMGKAGWRARLGHPETGVMDQPVQQIGKPAGRECVAALPVTVGTISTKFPTG